MLENQLRVYTHNHSEDDLRKQLAKVLEEKQRSENTSKESVKSLLQEKIDFAAKLSQLQARERESAILLFLVCNHLPVFLVFTNRGITTKPRKNVRDIARCMMQTSRR